MESKPAQVKNGTRTYLINGDYIKFHTVFKDGSEIVEEYGIYSEELESRRVKKIGMTGTMDDRNRRGSKAEKQ